MLSDTSKRAAYDAGGLPGVEALDRGQAHCPPSQRSTGGQLSEEMTPEAVEQERRREQAFATYRAVFGHNPMADIPRGGGAGVHNMAAQRGGGSFDDLQRQKLNELFTDLGLDQKAQARSSSSGSGRASSTSGGRGNGFRAPTPDGWYH